MLSTVFRKVFIHSLFQRLVKRKDVKVLLRKFCCDFLFITLSKFSGDSAEEKCAAVAQDSAILLTTAMMNRQLTIF